MHDKCNTIMHDKCNTIMLDKCNTIMHDKCQHVLCRTKAVLRLGGRSTLSGVYGSGANTTIFQKQVQLLHIPYVIYKKNYIDVSGQLLKLCQITIITGLDPKKINLTSGNQDILLFVLSTPSRYCISLIIITQYKLPTI